MTKKTVAWVTPLILLIVLLLIFLLGDWHYAYTPPLNKVLNSERTNAEQAYDVWGDRITHEQADSLLQTESGAMLSASAGAVRIDEEVLELGRRVFYEETFNNEIYFTDILGVMEGPVSFWGITRALFGLGGGGTNNLLVRASRDAGVGGRTIRRGDIIHTGIDVAKGSYAPIGIKFRIQRGRLMMGITCAACHSAYDPDSELVIEGAPNINLNAGLLLAMGTNSASFFANTDMDDLERFITENSPRVLGSDGKMHYLPDSEQLERAVDSTLDLWPPGSFDSFNDTRATPSRIPDSFTLGDHPYGWTGFAMAGPFRGLSMMNNNVHGLNSDKFSDTEAFHQLQGIDREVYLGTLLQNAAHPGYRYDPESGETPSEFFARINPAENSPGPMYGIELPTYPLASYMTPNGLSIGTPGHKVWEEVNAMSAFQNSLVPPSPPMDISSTEIVQGRTVFLEAGCRHCHSGPAFTNNRVIPVEEIETEPVRARAHEEQGRILLPSIIYPFNVDLPVPRGSRTVDVPMDRIDTGQIELAWAIGGTDGGYKVKGLLGLHWSAPYLHDGGVAAGSNLQTELGLPGTLFMGIPADPYNSLLALIDRDLRHQVVEANRQMPGLQEVNVHGIGHEFWVDEENGFDQDDQHMLIQYLLNLEWDSEN